MLEEVLFELKQLSLKGPIKSVGDGSNNAIGFTLRNALNIRGVVNDYKGFRINATSFKNNSRNTLIPGCVPDWKISNLKSSREFVDLYGTEDETGKYEKKLFCTVDAITPNSFGLCLKVDKKNKLLQENYVKGNIQRNLFIWDNNKLIQNLTKKNKLVIVSASKHKRNDGMYFHFKEAEFFLNIQFDEFLNYIDYGVITMDHLVSVKRGSNGAKEQGPSFKISKESSINLYEEYMKFDLMD